MFVNFFFELKKVGVPVSLKEYLTLMEAMQSGVAGYRVNDFYYLSRSALVKDERNLDRFDRVFGQVFKGLEASGEDIEIDLPEEWLRKLAELHLSDEEKAEIERLGGWEKLM
ncbi:MAG TPA: VWA domain-containing protein, partial [Rhodospirillaceae bacterium]|nr:VWA domain-containing protein [Rhodospirillaceae bacterium]